MFLYSTGSSPQDYSKYFTLHLLADLFIPFQLLWEPFSHAAIIARGLFVKIATSVCIARYSFIQLSELWQHGMNKIAKAMNWKQEDLNPGSLD